MGINLKGEGGREGMLILRVGDWERRGDKAKKSLFLDIP